MGELITKPDANPVLLAVLNIVIFGLPIGYLMIGQTKKAIVSFVITLVASVVTCGAGGLLVCLVWAYDVYLLGQKLAAGESIADNENGLDLLNNVPGFN
jgi:hypothetical protein